MAGEKSVYEQAEEVKETREKVESGATYTTSNEADDDEPTGFFKSDTGENIIEKPSQGN